MVVHLNVIDLNDNRPEFLTQENPVEISVSSYLETGELIAKMEAWDSDLGENADLRYAITPTDDDEDETVFHIDETSGDIVLLAPLINRVGQVRDPLSQIIISSVQKIVIQ